MYESQICQAGGESPIEATTTVPQHIIIAALHHTTITITITTESHNQPIGPTTTLTAPNNLLKLVSVFKTA